MKHLEYSTKPKIINTSQLKEVIFNLIFIVKSDLKKGFYLNMLDYLICTSSKKFPDTKKFINELKKYYLSEPHLFVFNRGDCSYIIYEFSLPKENLIKDYNFEKSFKYVIDILYNPDSNNGKFNLDKFNYEKDYLIDITKQKQKNMYDSNWNQLLSIIDPNEQMALSYKTALDLLINSNSKELYDIYMKSIVNNSFFSIVYGDVENKKIYELFNKYLHQASKKIKIDYNYFDFMELLEYKGIEIETDFVQTEIDMIYQFRNLAENDMNYFDIIYRFLNDLGNSLFIKNLKTKKNLVYESNIYQYNRQGFYLVSTYSEYKNKNEIIKIVKTIFDLLKDENIVKECLNNMLKSMKIDLLKDKESPFYSFVFETNKQEGIKNQSDLIKEYKKIQFKELVNFIKKIELTQIITFKGTEK